MVKYIEHFPTKFNGLTFAEFRSLYHREVSVIETWSNNYIPSQTAEMTDWDNEWAGVKPAIRCTENRDWTSYVRPQGIVDTCECCVIPYG